VIESWHSTVEFELRRVEHFATRAQARARVAAWIEEYNTVRRHSACGMMPRHLGAGPRLRAGRGVSAASRCAAQDKKAASPLTPGQAAAFQAGGRAARGYGAAPRPQGCCAPLRGASGAPVPSAHTDTRNLR
jgi:transposase InsO family protein